MSVRALPLRFRSLADLTTPNYVNACAAGTMGITWMCAFGVLPETDDRSALRGAAAAS